MLSTVPSTTILKSHVVLSFLLLRASQVSQATIHYVLQLKTLKVCSFQLHIVYKLAVTVFSPSYIERKHSLYYEPLKDIIKN